MISLLRLFVCFALATSASFALAAEEASSKLPPLEIKFEKYKLSNGLTVILHADSRAPMLSYHTWFRVGSRYERPGITGIAHMFEHLMFKGTEKYPDGQFDIVLQSNGADNNAFTTHDFTAYYQNFPSDKLELMMQIEADRMVNLQLNEKMFESEREVVKEERRVRIDNQPRGALSEALFKTMYGPTHPYGWPVIGWMKDIASYKLADFKQWYKTYYAPNNAVVVISGDQNIAQTKKLIEKYYGPIPQQEIPATPMKPLPDQRGQRELALTKPVTSTLISLGYRGAKAGEREGLALDLLGKILGDGTSSRLHQKLVYQTGLATAVHADHYSMQESGLFSVQLSLKPKVSEARARQLALIELYRLRNTEVTAEELEKARTQIVLDFVNELKTVAGRAEVLAQSEVLMGDPVAFKKDIETYQEITAKELKTVAEKYLTPQRATVAILRPPGGAQPASVPAPTPGVAQ